MNAKEGIWEIEKGKGNRFYINCSAEQSIMHPSELCKGNGLGVYGYENLKDLAIAILRFEKQQQEQDSIFGNI